MVTPYLVSHIAFRDEGGLRGGKVETQIPQSGDGRKFPEFKLAYVDSAAAFKSLLVYADSAAALEPCIC